MRSRVDRVRWLVLTVAFALLLSLPHLVTAATVVNPLCSGEDVAFNPGNGEDIVVPPGFKVSVFVTGLNAPTAVAFRGSAKKFEVFVLESGHGLPSICNDEVAFQTAHPSAPNPRSEEHTSELQSPCNLVCRLLLEKKKKQLA